MVRNRILAEPMFDGVFYDCWHPDDWLVPRTAALCGDKRVVMINPWNLPDKGFEYLNGCLAEDEINRVVEGSVDFEDFLARYLRWCRESRKPPTTTNVCHPRMIREDPWTNHKRSRAEREALKKKAQFADLQMMRFGLTTTLMGDGYFAFDGGNGLSRGNWWWYPEYDAPLGYPRGPARRRPDGLWERRYDGGIVMVNGSGYDAVVDLPTKCRDVSTGRVGTRFTIPFFDGRIFIPTDAPASAGEDVPPRLTRRLPAKPEVVRLDDNLIVARVPGGLELRFRPTGEVTRILLAGRTLMTGGWPVVVRPGWHRFLPSAPEPPRITTDTEQVRLTFRGQLRQGGKRIDYVETAELARGNRLSLRYDFTVRDALDIRMWRHYFAFPTNLYAGRRAEVAGTSATLPRKLGKPSLLPAGRRIVIDGLRGRIVVVSSVPMSLVDHRKWGRSEFLLAGYPVHGRVSAGTKLTVEVRVHVLPPRG